ncbi:ATP-dependent metallopeptidase HflB1 [Butyrivibrio proteoclasticus B316]|uniref:ATP-dependent zinc metalloprotease FtsH n=1 Tax=Butyrivibrio proteoclasticus (strain ATCC 51982 / DSM 14932 / B316) TaxID=515622 RepID=E0RUF4_BUTPB|nr:ATP-dependent zinc metalloprotease FtsH [Butyrivibrio proteoclasticus]ADL32844.1 ATP-dependent metallopeptidase HflB1 [Butyrivibrio proteoclasticus B316]
MDNNQNQRNNNPLGDGSNSPRRQNIILLLVAALVTMICMTYFLRAFSENTNQEWTYTQFIQAVDEGRVDSIVITDDRINITLKEDADKVQGGRPSLVTTWGGVGTMTYYTGKAEDDSDLTQRMIEAGVTVSSEVPDNSGVILSFFLYYVAPILLMWLILSLIFRKMGRGGGPLSVGKSNAKIYVQKETGVTFKDVAGEDEAKESLVEVVDFLHNPAKYAKIGAKLPKGALLVGPPGTGKTLLAKAVAGEAHVPFYSLAGSDFIELYVGVGASRVRDLFSEASKNAPCIIFIDEIDAIGRSRDSKYGGGNEEREQTLNQLLSEMDGFDSSKGVLILGATNRPEILDKALLRPGRFDRRIIVDKPDLKGREEILKVHSKDVKMDETVDLKGIALATSGAVGSDLANMINEAAINAVKAHREYVCQQDLMEAVEQVLVGKEKKDRILSKEERKIVSYHEVGHALISAVQKNTEPVQKITIVPRTMGALGYVMQVPEDEKYLQTKDEIIDDIIVSLGGRAAEEVIFNTVTTGAENDIEKATSMARSMITMFGMSDRFGLMQLESVQNRYLDGNRVLNCSDETATLVDAEVQKLLAECYEKAKQIIREHLDAMDKIAQFLIEKETITGKEFMKIYREVENIPEPTEEEIEAAKRGRIYATRAESALVGENVPVKTPKKEETPDTPSIFDQDNGSSLNPQNPDQSQAPEYGQFQSIFDAQVTDDGVQNTASPAGDNSDSNDQPEVGNDNRGRFSNVPNDFDK